MAKFRSCLSTHKIIIHFNTTKSILFLTKDTGKVKEVKSFEYHSWGVLQQQAPQNQILMVSLFEDRLNLESIMAKLTQILCKNYNKPFTSVQVWFNEGLRTVIYTTCGNTGRASYVRTGGSKQTGCLLSPGMGWLQPNFGSGFQILTLSVNSYISTAPKQKLNLPLLRK